MVRSRVMSSDKSHGGHTGEAGKIPEKISADPLIDLAVFGRHLRAARILAGYETVHAAAHHISEVAGISLSERSLGAMERGEQMPSMEQFVAISLALKPPGGGTYWLAMLRADLVAAWIEELDEDEVRRRGKHSAPLG